MKEADFWEAGRMKLAVTFLRVLMFVLCPVVLAQTKSPLEIKYDKFKDLTNVSVRDLSVDGGQVSGLQDTIGFYISAGYICPGNTTHCVPRRVEFLIVDHWGIGETAHDLTFLADGKRLPTFNTDRTESYDGEQSEHIDALIPVAMFRKIAYAQSLEGEVGPATFKLNASALAGLRSLADEILQ